MVSASLPIIRLELWEGIFQCKGFDRVWFVVVLAFALSTIWGVRPINCGALGAQ